MKNQDRNHILLWLFAIAVALALNSCGTFKKDKTQTEEVTKTEIEDQSKNDKSEIAETQGETNIKKSQELTVDDQNQTESVKEVIEPLDPTKPASYVDEKGKKQELNNAKKTTETKKEKNNKKTESATKTDTSQKLATKATKKESADNDIKAKTATKKAAEEIHMDRESWSLWNLLWLLIPVGIYWTWKNKVKIIGWVNGLWWV